MVIIKYKAQVQGAAVKSMQTATGLAVSSTTYTAIFDAMRTSTKKPFQKISNRITLH